MAVGIFLDSQLSNSRIKSLIQYTKNEPVRMV